MKVSKFIVLILSLFTTLLSGNLFAQESEGLADRLSRAAASLVGHNGQFLIENEVFNGDCTGFLMAVFYKTNIDLRAITVKHVPHKELTKHMSYNLFLLFNKKNWIHWEIPKKGDVIFFGNTYDQNGNKVPDDVVTHVGIVDEVNEQNASFTFYHKMNVRAAVSKDRMSLNHPYDTSRNSMIGRSFDSHRTAGACFVAFGRFEYPSTSLK